MSNSALSFPKISATLALLSAVSINSFAINTNESQNELNVPPPLVTKDAVEIITVTGSRPLNFFRDQFRDAEDDFFAALNRLTEKEEYKIVCDSATRSFTHLTSRSCEPKYVDMVKADLTKKALNIGSMRRGIEDKIKNLPTRRKIEQKIAKKRKAHLKFVKELVSNSPELQLKLMNLNKAKYSLEQKKVETFGEGLVSEEAIEVIAQTKEFVEQAK